MTLGARVSYARCALGVLIYNVAVILWGAYVRASGSGAGCGRHWPLCDGEVIPTAPDVKRMIEFAHRASSGVDGLLVLLLCLGAFRLFAKGSSVRFFAAISLALTVLEGALGAGLVLLEHTANNKSDARMLSISLHLANTLALLAALTLTWQHARAQRTRAASPVRVRWVALGAGALVVVSMIGAVTALGDTLYPARSLAEGMRADISPMAATAQRLRALHPALALCTAGYLVWFSGRAKALLQSVEDRRFATALRHIVLGQVAFGVLNLLLLVPVWSQLVHLLLADALWIVFVVVVSRLFWRPQNAEA